MEYAGKNRDRSPLSGMGPRKKADEKPKARTVLLDDSGADWQPLKAYLVKPTIPGQMSNLEKLQRIAGSLGKRADEVRFGLEGPTMQEVGKLLGTEGERWSR